jgi:hypothetical protein
MAKPIFHAINSSKKFGGKPADYQAIHCKLDESKSAYPQMSHRIVLHSTFGRDFCVKLFGESLLNSDGQWISVAEVVNQHVLEDLGFLPSMEEWFKELPSTSPLVKSSYFPTEQQCKISAKNFGGIPAEYYDIHHQMNNAHTDPAGKVVFHHSYGTFLIEDLFGVGFTNSAGRVVSTREVAEQHILRTFRKIPTLEDWIKGIDKPWMAGIRKTKLILVD